MAFWRRERKPRDLPEPRKLQTSSATNPYGEDGTIFLDSKDDLMTRAEKITYIMGYRGAVGSFVLNVYRVLQRYEQLDDAKNTETPHAHR